MDQGKSSRLFRVDLQVKSRAALEEERYVTPDASEGAQRHPFTRSPLSHLGPAQPSPPALPVWDKENHEIYCYSRMVGVE
jgi:hypothetical protein